MNKADLHKKLEALGVTFQENDTNEQLALMIAGKEAPAKLEALMTAKNEAVAANDELTAAKEEAETKLAEAVAANTELTTTIAEMQKEVSAAADRAEKAEAEAPNSLPIVTYKKKSYQVAYPNIRVGGNKVSAKELAEDSELIAELVKMGSGALIEVES